MTFTVWPIPANNLGGFATAFGDNASLQLRGNAVDVGANRVNTMTGNTPATRIARLGHADTELGRAAEQIRLPAEIAGRIERIIGQRFAPAAVVIDHRTDILYLTGPTHLFFRVPSGVPNRNLFSMLKHGLHALLSSLIDEALHDRRARHTEAGRIRIGQHFRKVALSVVPLDDQADTPLLIVLRDMGRISTDKTASSEVALALSFEEDLAFIKLGFERAIEQQYRLIAEQGALIDTLKGRVTEADARDRENFEQIMQLKSSLAASRAQADDLNTCVEQRTEHIRLLMSAVAMTELRERKALTRDLHDDLAQVLCVIQLKLDALLDHHLPPTERMLANDCDALLKHANQSLRSLMTELSPRALEEGGLLGGIKWLIDDMARRFGLAVRLTQATPPFDPPEPARTVLFRVIREFLINTAKHAGTDLARISLHPGDNPSVLCITVEDEGCGFDPDALASDAGQDGGGFGLRSAQERIASIGGHCLIDSRPGQGARFMLHYPLPGRISHPPPNEA